MPFIVAGGLILGILVLIFASSTGVLKSEADLYAVLSMQKFPERAPAPEFTLPTAGGGSVSLGDLRGKVVLLNFFATWCEPCRWEMPAMERLYQEYRGKGLAVLAVSIDVSRGVIAPFARKLNLTFPIVHDPGQVVARSYGFRGPPLSFLIDREGRVIAAAAGPREWDGEMSRTIVQELLGEAKG